MLRRTNGLLLSGIVAAAAACQRAPAPATDDFTTTGDIATVASHLAQNDIANKVVGLQSVIDQGKLLFSTSFNDLDGATRPETTGTGVHRNRRDPPQTFNRISGDDANSCAGCHNLPKLGGGGDNVSNVFVLGQRFGFVNFDGSADDGRAPDGVSPATLQNVANERNTLGMFGSGFIELLAREITTDLQAIKASAIAQAIANNADKTLSLDSKGINYGSIEAHPDGTVDTSLVAGVDADLVIRPFHQKGVVVSLREFTNNAFNHHHGMQTEERFGTGQDPDNDGHVNELTVGDVTSTVLFQATLPAPGRVFPGASGPEVTAAAKGETLFNTIGCTSCHVPDLVLNSPVFTEPNPFNPAGNLRPQDVPTLVSVDLTTEGPGPHLARESNGTVIVHAYTDLKRHDMGAALTEPLTQAGVPGKMFITRKLWGTANEPPFMHDGRSTTIKDAILRHAGEAQAQHDAYAALSTADQDRVVAFLKTLQILPDDATSNEIIGQPTGFIGDTPTLGGGHIDQTDINNGVYSPEALESIGKTIFAADFNTLDGQGRPTSTGTGAPRAAHVTPENFNRISAPDANSCAGCHNMPRTGGGGDNVSNVFVLGQKNPFIRFDGGPDDSNTVFHLDNVADERNTLGMWGSGFIELLAREMSTDLATIQNDAKNQAQLAGHDVTLALASKGVSFGSITAHSNGTFDMSGVVGVGKIAAAGSPPVDLVVRPFHQKGVVVSLREFTNNAENHHHGMQSDERFDPNNLGLDPDGDSVLHELSRGDITATALFQAMMPVPGRKLPSDPKKLAAVNRGDALFNSLGCAVCHVPELKLDSPIFTEPNPFNVNALNTPNMVPADVPQPFAVDLTAHGVGPRLPKEVDGSVLVPAYTDLKRHDMGANLNNEKLLQNNVPTTQFITKKLWGFFSEPPFGHDSRSLTVGDIILRHGGEAQAQRDAFAALSTKDQKCVIDFLKTLQVLPENSPLVVKDGN